MYSIIYSKVRDSSKRPKRLRYQSSLRQNAHNFCFKWKRNQILAYNGSVLEHMLENINNNFPPLHKWGFYNCWNSIRFIPQLRMKGTVVLNVRRVLINKIFSCLANFTSNKISLMYINQFYNIQISALIMS